MHGKLKWVVGGIVLLLALVGVQNYREFSVLKSIDSYESCVSAKGSRIQESYPATCITRLGTRYIQPTPSPVTIINSPLPRPSSPASSQSPSPKPVNQYSLANWTSLQSHLQSKCQQYPFGNAGASIYGIKTADLPFRFDTGTLEIYTGDTLFCTETVDSSRPAYGAVFQVKTRGTPTDWKQMHLYNDETVNKFATDTYGLKGTVIGAKDSITYSLYFSEPSVYCSAGSPRTYFIDSLEVIVRAEKKFALTHGENLYLNIATTVLTPDNERLRNLLSETASPCSGGDPRLATALQGLGDKAKNRFFSNLEQLASPEKEAVNYLTTLLNTITLSQ